MDRLVGNAALGGAIAAGEGGESATKFRLGRADIRDAGQRPRSRGDLFEAPCELKTSTATAGESGPGGMTRDDLLTPPSRRVRALRLRFRPGSSACHLPPWHGAVVKVMLNKLPK